MKHSILIAFGIALLGAINSASQEGLWPVTDVIAEVGKKLFCRKHRQIDHFPAGSCPDGTCTHAQGQMRCQKKCLEDKDCVGINYSKEFGYEGRCDVCNECDGKVCEGTEGHSNTGSNSDLQSWPKGGFEYYPIHEPGCTCAGKNNKYNEGASCKTYSGYTDSWYNGKWCYASVATCPDAAEHKGNMKQGSGYGASRVACKPQWSEYSNIVRDTSKDNKKCSYWVSGARVFTLRNADATEIKCRTECSKNDKCVAVSGKWNQYCFGCDRELSDTANGFIAFKKTGTTGSTGSTLPPCTDLWAEYVSKTAPVTKSLSSNYGDLFTFNDLSGLYDKIKAGEEYTMVIKVSSTCTSDVEIGLSGFGGWFKTDVPANAKNLMITVTDTWKEVGNYKAAFENRNVCSGKTITIHQINLVKESEDCLESDD